MLRLLLILGVVLLGACSQTPKTMTEAGLPYCYVDETHIEQAGTVDSEIVTQCSDRPGAQASVQRAGIDVGCEEFWYTENRRGNLIQQRGVYCEKIDGSTEIINIDGNNS